MIMRHAAALICASTFLSTCLFAEGYGPSLTVLLDFQEAASDTSVDALQRELKHLLKPAGVKIQVRLTSDVPSNQTFEDLVLFRLRGNCARPIDPLLLDE